MNILIVEDDQVLGGLLKSYLARMGGYTVKHVEKGWEAINIFENSNFDCVFVDLQLPDINGIEVLKSIKARDPAVPVIMMSGNVSMASSIEAMRLGASDFLAKPFNFQQVIVSLERAFKERQILLDNIALKLEIEARKELERLNEELAKNLEVQTRLFQISREFDDVRSSEELYQLLVKWALDLTGAQEVGIFAILPSRDGLFLLAREVVPGVKEILPKIINLFPQGEIILPDYAGIGRTSLCAITDLAHSITFLGSANIASYLNVPPESIRIWQLEIRKEVFGLIIAFYPKAEVYTPEYNEQIFQFLLKKASLTIENLALYESLMANFYGILRSLVNALEAKDIYTGKHSERVTLVADYLARTMGRPMEELDAINTIGYLHDIGKIGIPDHILNKPGRLSTDEFELIKSHPTIGENIVKELGLSEIERSIIRHHHERWDGKGYPDGIGGEDIPFITRIVTVADAYDAMTTNRPYRKALDKDTVRNEFLRNKGIQFDPQVVEAMFDVFEKLPHEDDNNG